VLGVVARSLGVGNLVWLGDKLFIRRRSSDDELSLFVGDNASVRAFPIT